MQRTGSILKFLMAGKHILFEEMDFASHVHDLQIVFNRCICTGGLGCDLNLNMFVILCKSKIFQSLQTEEEVCCCRSYRDEVNFGR
jgi:hypothetical protein